MKVLILGSTGMVGKALINALARSSHDIFAPTRTELDLTDQRNVRQYFGDLRFDRVFLAAAKVGGILANQSTPAEFIYDNTMIQSNVIEAAFKSEVNRLLFLGSSCIYPRDTRQPIRESSLMTDRLEVTNEAYAIAKISGIYLCNSFRKQYGCDFRNVMPTNLYGPDDNFDSNSGHVIPALIKRFYEAVESEVDEIEIWGTGNPKREFLHVDDLARALCQIMDVSSNVFSSIVDPDHWIINIGSGFEISIFELAGMLTKISGFRGRLKFNPALPDGTPRKILDSSALSSLNWQPKINFEKGLTEVYHWYSKNRRT